MNAENPLKLLEILTDHGVRFVLIGGHAVNYHGYIRATEDIDIIFLRSSENEIKLFDALQSVCACWISDEIDPTTNIEKTVPVSQGFISSNHLMMLTTDYGYIDIFDYIPENPDEPVERIFQDALMMDGFRIVSLDWLNKMKAASGRQKDQDDIRHLI